MQCSIVTAASLKEAARERLSSCVALLKGLGTCLAVLVVVGLWFAVESVQGFGVVS